MASSQGDKSDEGGGGISLNLVIALLSFGLIAAIVIFAVKHMRRV